MGHVKFVWSIIMLIVAIGFCIGGVVYVFRDNYQMATFCGVMLLMTGRMNGSE